LVKPRKAAAAPEDDCHSDCASSASVVDDGDGDGDASTVRSRAPLGLDLNLPAPVDDDQEGLQLLCTELRL
jgi:EREBP-like factor